MNNLPQRKNIRLKNYDYSQNGAYFITICVKDRHEMLGNIVGAIINRPTNDVIQLSKCGAIVNNAINDILNHYPNVFVDKYIIMPNHIHMILLLQENGGRLIISPTTTSTIIQQLKRYVSKQIGFSIWQKSFHDHIIRNEAEYLKIWRYIDTNPLKWEDDCYYKLDNAQEQNMIH